MYIELYHFFRCLSILQRDFQGWILFILQYFGDAYGNWLSMLSDRMNTLFWHAAQWKEWRMRISGRSSVYKENRLICFSVCIWGSLFYAIRNFANQIRRRAMHGFGTNCNTAATISGDSPLFYSFGCPVCGKEVCALKIVPLFSSKYI